MPSTHYLGPVTAWQPHVGAEIWYNRSLRLHTTRWRPCVASGSMARLSSACRRLPGGRWPLPLPTRLRSSVAALQDRVYGVTPFVFPSGACAWSQRPCPNPTFFDMLFSRRSVALVLATRMLGTPLPCPCDPRHRGRSASREFSNLLALVDPFDTGWPVLFQN